MNQPKGIDMGSPDRKQIIIPKEDAVFWMDKNGTWHNEHGRFEHPKIIRYFNRSIKKDEAGYYVHQATDTVEEKVYFSYEDTAFFVVDVRVEPDMQFVLNTGETVRYESQPLFTKDDNLYLQTRDHRIKFSSRALLKISKYMEEKEGRFFFTINGKTYPVEDE